MYNIKKIVYIPIRRNEAIPNNLKNIHFKFRNSNSMFFFNSVQVKLRNDFIDLPLLVSLSNLSLRNDA